VYKALMGKPEGKRPLGRPRFKWNVVLERILGDCWGGGGLEWIQLAQGRDR
jgi:hypothetical protein